MWADIKLVDRGMTFVHVQDTSGWLCMSASAHNRDDAPVLAPCVVDQGFWAYRVNNPGRRPGRMRNVQPPPCLCILFPTNRGSGSVHEGLKGLKADTAMSTRSPKLERVHCQVPARCVARCAYVERGVCGCPRT